MSGGARHSLRRATRAFLPPALLLALFFLFLWLRVDARLIYHCHVLSLSVRFPAFLRYPVRLAEYAGRPGGLVEFVATWLSQLYYWAWSGAATLTLVTGLLCVGVWESARLVGGRAPRVAHWGPALLVLALSCKYLHALPVLLSIALGMGFACAYSGLARRLRIVNPLLRFGVFASLGCVTYYAAGGGFLVFVALCVLWEALAQRRRAAACVWLVLGAAFPYLIGTCLFGLAPGEAYGSPLLLLMQNPWSAARIVAGALCAYCPLSAMLLGVSGGRGVPGVSAPIHRALEVCFLVLAGALVGYVTFNPGVRAVLRIDLYGRDGRYEDVLREAWRVPPARYDATVAWDVNRALYHTGQLPERMFAYPQGPASLLETPLEFYVHGSKYYAVFPKAADILYDLGRLNDAEHMAAEGAQLLADPPWLLKRIALIRIAKRAPEAARVFLRALSSDLKYGPWARKMLRRLEADPTLSGDETMRRLRSLAPTRDSCRDATVEEILLEQLRVNPHNRMAFEYLMGQYLVTFRVDRVVEQLWRLDDLGYIGIPRCYEEAVLIHQARTGTRVDLHGRQISPGSLERFHRFEQIVRSCGGDRRAALRALRPDYGDSYFLYFWFNTSTTEQ